MGPPQQDPIRMSQLLPERQDLRCTPSHVRPAERIYLDWNATAPLRPEAWDALQPFLAQDFGNAASVHRHGQEAKAALERARALCAEVLGCAPEELVFTSGGTESDNLALRGLAWAARLRLEPSSPPGGAGEGGGAACRIICSEIEHSAVLETVRALGAQGFETVYVPARAAGTVDPRALADALGTPSGSGAVARGTLGSDARIADTGSSGTAVPTAVVALMYANNESGVIQPVAEAARACRERAGKLERRVVMHVDAVQAPGKLPLKVAALGCDTLALSGHKFEGPKGVGLLYVRRGTGLASHMTGGSHEGHLRGGTPNVAGAVGLAVALRLAEDEREETCSRLEALRARFEGSLREALPGVVIHGAEAARIPNTSFVSFVGLEGESLVIALDLEGLSVSTGAACTQGTSLPSHVLTGMGLPMEVVRGAVRFSFGRLTTAAEMEKALERVVRVTKRVNGS